jgi:hypothetical protein
MNAGSLEMRLNESRPVVASTGGEAEVFEANGLAIRWTDAAPGRFVATSTFRHYPFWLKTRSF